MSSIHKERHDNRRPTFRDHRTPQFGGGERRHQNPAHYPQRREMSPIRRSTGTISPIRRQNEPRHKSPEIRREHREHQRSDRKESKEAVVTSSSANAVSSGSTRGSTSTSASNRRNESGERHGEAERDEKLKNTKDEDRRKDRTDRSCSSNVAARIQAPVVSSSSSPHQFQRHHQDQRNEWKRSTTKRSAPDSRPMTYAAGASSSSTVSTSASHKRHPSGERQKSTSESTRRHGEKSSTASSRRHGDEKDKDRRQKHREDDKKNSDKSSSSRRREEADKERKSEKNKESVKEEDRIVNENREEDEAVAIQGLVEVDCCEGDESSEQNQKQDVVESADCDKPVPSPPLSNASLLSDSEEELDYEEDDIDIDLGEDIDVEIMKAAVKGELKVDDTDDNMDEEEVHGMKDDDEEDDQKKEDEPEKKRARTEKKDDKEKKNGSTPSKSHRRRDENKDVPSTSDRKEHRRSRSPARQRDTDRSKESRRIERTSTTERNTQRGGAGTEIQRIPSLLTMRIAAPPGIKKLQTLYHSSVGSPSEGFGETFSNRWCQCSCAHHLPSSSTAGSLDASPASTSSSNSDASVSRIPSLMSLRTPLINSCLFLAPSSQPSKRSHEPAARIRAPSPPQRPMGNRGFQRTEDHRGGRGGGAGPIRQRTPERFRRDERRGSTFDDRKRVDRAPIDNGRRRSPLRRRPSPPRGRPGEKVVQSYRNGV